ncbi:hypothetical protein BB560_004614 [Smittium megazygosporum]|uniref:Peptidyl-prolyl cis-trans isomerase n=1 Tax=Smittium megazygosporum TaxID=133381 RepID=A0A2T9Z8W9_9FUNG|nr:hypothetical protein BB560_004614 [Smittium megazygosporum]
MSRSRNMPYYFNTITKESRWDPPSGADLSKDPAGTDKIRASHILVKHAESRRPSSWKQENITRTKQEALEMILRFEKDIKSGTVSFEDLAEVESDCSSAKRKGDLGYFSRGQMQPSFENSAFGLQVGEISGPVYSDSGIHLIYRTA